MDKKIDIIGHFGTTLSYATVGSRVARALRDADLLGTVSNLDASWAPSMLDLTKQPQAKSSRCIVFAGSRHYMDAFVDAYGGADHTAIFMSPNTDRLGKEYAETCSKFGVAIVPSMWCQRVVMGSASPGRVSRLPLGVDALYFKDDLYNHDKRVAWHFTTDQALPGRKGTHELLQAWKLLQDNETRAAAPEWSLVIHAPLSIAPQIHYAAADLGLTESVSVVSAERLGSSDEALSGLVHRADMIVQPSRCEGFGMMMLAAVAARVPLVTTAITGQTDFLYDFPCWLGVPTDAPDRIAFEDGLAPVVAPEALARTLWAAREWQSEAFFATGLTDRTPAQKRWEWSVVLREWVEWAQAWVEE